MKKNNDSLHWQNAQLYFFGVIFNFVNLTVQDIKAGFEKGSWILLLFHGYNFYTCLLVCTLSSSGLLVSWIMKYADSIVKVSQASKRAIDRSIDAKSMRSRLALLLHAQAPLPFPCIQPAYPSHPNLRSDTTSSSFPFLIFSFMHPRCTLRRWLCLSPWSCPLGYLDRRPRFSFC